MTGAALSPMQMYKGRRLLRWSRKNLALRISASYEAIRIFEVDGLTFSGFDLERAREALEAAGVEFIVGNGSGAGARLRKSGSQSLLVEDLNGSNNE